jgi:hypothetical protein
MKCFSDKMREWRNSMFRTGSFIFRLVLALVLIGGLAAAGYMLFQAGQAQGYALGISAAGKEIQPAAPMMPYFPGYYYRPHFFFFPFGPLLGLLFWGFLIFFIAGRVFRHRHWQGAGPHHGYPPPWMRDQQAAPGQAGTPEPPKETPKSE